MILIIILLYTISLIYYQTLSSTLIDENFYIMVSNINIFDIIYQNDIWVLDLDANDNPLSWQQIEPSNPPLQGGAFTATLLADGNILYIGGLQKFGTMSAYANMNNVCLVN